MLATLPVLAIGISPWALLRGAIMPRSLQAIAPHLELARERDGHIDVGIGGAPAPAVTDPVRPAGHVPHCRRLDDAEPHPRARRRRQRGRPCKRWHLARHERHALAATGNGRDRRREPGLRSRTGEGGGRRSHRDVAASTCTPRYPDSGPKASCRTGPRRSRQRSATGSRRTSPAERSVRCARRWGQPERHERSGVHAELDRRQGPVRRPDRTLAGGNATGHHGGWHRPSSPRTVAGSCASRAVRSRASRSCGRR